MDFGWKGDKVQLVPLEKEKHFDNCVRWLNDPEVTRWLLIGDFPLTRVAEHEFFDRISRPNDHDVAHAIETLEEEHIGICGIHDINFRHGSGTCGLFIGRQKLWGRGYGSDAIAVHTRYGFEVLGLRLLLCDIFSENTASMKAYTKNGYKEVARIPRRWWKRGEYRDVVTFARQRD